jgi:hypothetical protein
MFRVEWKRQSRMGIGLPLLGRWELRRLSRDEVPPLGTREVLADWFREDGAQPMIEMQRYSQLLQMLPDKVVANLEKARLAREGKHVLLKAGLGFEELLASIIVDGTAIASSSSEARLAPALMIPANYMQPGGIPGRVLVAKGRGRGTTLTTGATMTMRHRIATTDVITGTTLAATGAMTADATGQTATMWEWDCSVVCRSVGSAGTVFAMGKAALAWHSAFTAANAALAYAGSAGSATPAAVTWDMTLDQFFQFTGQWSLATAYSMQAHIYRLESLN